MESSPSSVSSRGAKSSRASQEPSLGRLVVYDDSAVFGGHEVMTLLGVRGLLAEGMSILFVYAEANAKLAAALIELQKEFCCLTLFSYPHPSRKLQGLRNHLESGKIGELAQRFIDFSPHAVVCAQGDLELSSRGLLAAKRAGLLTLSYIPFAHTQAEMGAKLGRLRDPFNAYLLDIPDLIITISNDAKAHFRNRGARGPISVVYNGIDVGRFGGSRKQAREQFELPEQDRVIALCGRLESVQKGQPLLLRAVSETPWLRDNVTTLLVGDGPDEEKLRRLVYDLGMEKTVRFTGWCDPAPLYPALDAVVLASRYEGMPLVMLEALASGVPVVAPDRDGMRELLPRAWRFTPGDAQDLAHCLEGVLTEPRSPELDKLKSRVRDEMSISAFQKSFAQTIREHCGL